VPITESQAGELSFYEEFGVEPTSSAEEIHDAFRALARLLHPDQHPDPALKEIAERQMRKINRIYAVLSDPERRRRYDETLEEDLFPPTIIVNAAADNPNVRRLIGRFAWIGAVLVSAVLLIWLASSQSSQKVREPLVSSYDPSDPGPSSPESSAADEIQRLRSSIRTLTVERDAAVREIVRLRGNPAPFLPLSDPPGASPATPPAVALTELPSTPRAVTPVTASAPANASPQPNQAPTANATPVPVGATGAKSAPVAPAPAPVVAAAAPVKATPPVNPAPLAKPTPAENRHLAGSWFYNKPADGQHNRNPSLYPPEYIEATITEENGTVRGRYRSRFVVSDRAISPEVNFSFACGASGSTATCPWSGAGGAKGEVTLTLMPENSMRIDWTAKQMGTQLGLASGTAVLRRKD
jgi:hypothetical protein